MSARIAYLSRADRGARLIGVRLLGAHADDTWNPGAAQELDPVSGAASDARGAGKWIAQRLAERAGASLAALCLDADGATCSWVSSPSAEPAAIASIARQGPAHEEAVPGLSSAQSPLSYFAESPQDSQVQGLVEPAPGKRRHDPSSAPERVGVLAVGDLAARLVVDELDDAGVPVDQVTTLYHLLAAAWDPSARQTSAAITADSDVIVSDSAPVTAIVLVEPAGRLVWAWSRRGLLLAGGSIRLPMLRLEPVAEPADNQPLPESAGEARLSIHDTDIARLCAEWISWSMQLGVAPDRAVCLLPESAAMVETESGTVPTAQLLGKRWGNIPIDAAIHEDPIGATLLRVIAKEEDRAQLAADPRAGLPLLSHRPTRAHQRLYFWAAGAVLLISAGLAIAAWRVESAAAAARRAAEAYKVNIEAMVQQVHPPARISQGGVTLALRQELAKLQKQFAPVEKSDPSQPILDELDTLSSVLGAPELELTEIQLTNTTVTVKVVTPDLPTAELVLDALRSVGGSHVGSWSQTFTQQTGAQNSGKVSAIFNGLWAADKPKPAGGAS